VVEHLVFIILTEFQEEEQRLRKVALNISKDVKKFWMKIEKLVSSLSSMHHHIYVSF